MTRGLQVHRRFTTAASLLAAALFCGGVLAVTRADRSKALSFEELSFSRGADNGNALMMNDCNPLSIGKPGLTPCGVVGAACTTCGTAQYQAVDLNAAGSYGGVGNMKQGCGNIFDGTCGVVNGVTVCQADYVFGDTGIKCTGPPNKPLPQAGLPGG